MNPNKAVQDTSCSWSFFFFFFSLQEEDILTETNMTALVDDLSFPPQSRYRHPLPLYSAETSDDVCVKPAAEMLTDMFNEKKMA